METVSVQIPAALYVSLFDRFGEKAGQEIEACLANLLTGSMVQESPVSSITGRYPRPRDGTITGKVWEIADRVFSETGASDRNAVVEACLRAGINVNTASTQYSYWKKANV